MSSDLVQDGIMTVNPLPYPAETLAYLEGRTRYPGHVKGASVAAHQPGNSTCWSMEDVLTAPRLLEVALALTDDVGRYLGRPPLLYSVNAFTTYPISGPLNPDIQEWHVDKDDVRFVALFVYLTDVLREEDGAHQFQVSDGRHMTVLGPAGMAFLADTSHLHRGLRPLQKNRTMAWARWCVTDPPASYLWDGQRPSDRAVLGSRYPSDKRLQESIRLVVQ
jgi:hypothetical protein